MAGAAVHLTPHQFELLRVLAVNEGKLMTHRALLREVWGPGYGSESNLPARERLSAPAQDRAGPGAPALPADRARGRLPARASRLAPSEFLQAGPRDLHASFRRAFLPWRYEETRLRPAGATASPRGRQPPSAPATRGAAGARPRACRARSRIRSLDRVAVGRRSRVLARLRRGAPGSPGCASSLGAGAAPQTSGCSGAQPCGRPRHY